MPRQGFVEKSITGADQFTDQICFEIETDKGGGGFEVSISGTFVATVTIQRKFEGKSVWQDVFDFTAPNECVGNQVDAKTFWRIGVKTGNFTSGPIEVRLAQ